MEGVGVDGVVWAGEGWFFTTKSNLSLSNTLKGYSLLDDPLPKIEWAQSSSRAKKDRSHGLFAFYPHCKKSNTFIRHFLRQAIDPDLECFRLISSYVYQRKPF